MSKTHLPADFLDLPVERAARIVALSLLHDVSDARERLIDPADAEALHDFRVAIRRLRSWLRSYRTYLGTSTPRKALRRLKRIARAAGAARDAEVQRTWLVAHLAAPERKRLSGVAHLLSLFDARERDAKEALRSVIGKYFARVASRLEASLSSYSVTLPVNEPPPPTVPMALAAATAVRRDARALQEALEHVRSIDDQTAAHETRIIAKRLRYGLEPLREFVEGVEEAIQRLAHLQDALGQWHDAVVILAEVLAEAEAAVPDDATRAELAALAATLHHEMDEGFRIVQQEWRGDHAREFFAAVERVAHLLAVRAPPDQEIERKYLLRALPQEVRKAPKSVIEQGYVPGDRLRERLRRIRTNGVVHLYRAVKLGTGLTRTEIEEETTSEIFRTMWPLTKGHRIRKRRYTIADGDRTWEIDEYLDRAGLVVAEVELPAADSPAEPPEWLAPYIVREVTGEAEFQNVNLAR